MIRPLRSEHPARGFLRPVALLALSAALLSEDAPDRALALLQTAYTERDKAEDAGFPAAQIRPLRQVSAHQAPLRRLLHRGPGIQQVQHRAHHGLTGRRRAEH